MKTPQERQTNDRLADIGCVQRERYHCNRRMHSITNKTRKTTKSFSKTLSYALKETSHYGTLSLKPANFNRK
jgi:hypothetical protein